MPKNVQKTLIKWTPQAIDCFERSCDCEGCIINMSLETKCKMKNIISTIYEQCGYPPESKVVEEDE